VAAALVSFGYKIGKIRTQGSKAFFSEEKKQKTFKRWRGAFRNVTRQRMKVFWFFFSKKNRFLG
jgi:hypothetical protein